MTTYYKYKLKCITENANKYWILPETDSEPSTCPTDTSHTVSSIVTIDDEISDNYVRVKEESTPTGGNFGTKTIVINALKNAVNSVTFSWPYPTSILALEFVTEEMHRGDSVTVAVGENTIIGAITAAVSPASAWTSQNYTVGQIATYNSRTYTCILNTVSNDVPTDVTYWKHGYELTVQSSVIENIGNGFYIGLDDFTNSDDMGRVISIDKSNYKMYVETNPANSYSAVTPTYVRVTVKPFADFEINAPWLQVIGQNKIGGSYIPADVIITAYYDNRSADTDKKFVGVIEYLY